MAIKPKDFIEITYTGTVSGTGEIFDTTDETLAHQQGIWSKAGHYGPQIICVGEQQVLPGLDEQFPGKDTGTYTLTVSAEKGFGKKNPQLIQLIPISTFKMQKIQPVIGMQLNIDGQLGTVKVASGGRVLVDFNHLLAGKELTYTVTIHTLIHDTATKLKAMLSLSLHLPPDTPLTIQGEEATIELPHAIPDSASGPLAHHLAGLCGLKNVIFTVATKSPQTTKDLNKNAESSDG